MDNQKIIKTVKNWIEQFIIGYNICPFARKVFITERIKYVVNSSTDDEIILQAFLQELQWLNTTPAKKIDTTLFILTNAFPDFDHYLNFIYVIETMIEQLNYEGIYQVATFHPIYQFDGTQLTDAENFTNRSPFPIIHILREESVEKAIENYPNPEEIPKRNIALMNEMGVEKLRTLFLKFSSKSNDY
jgi:hypothetical protein